MGIRLVKIENLGGLTAKVLEKFSQLPGTPGERELKKKRVAWIQGLLKSGRFNRCEWAQCVVKKTRKNFRVNGQHSSHCLRSILEGNLEATFPEGVPVEMMYYECDDMNGLAEVFDEFDSHKSGRDAFDKLGEFYVQHPDMTGINKKFCSQVLTGVDWACRHVPSLLEVIPAEYRPTEAYDRGVLLNSDKVRGFLDMMYQFDNAPFREWLQKSGIVARLFEEYLAKDKEDAELEVQQILYEVGATSLFTKKVRSMCKQTGKDQGFFYRETDKCVVKLNEENASLTREDIKEMIREVQKEQEGEEVEEPVEA